MSSPIFDDIVKVGKAEPKLLAEINIPTNNEARLFLETCSVHPANFHTIGSYNWLANLKNQRAVNSPSIAVPGYPACWIPPSHEDPPLEPDSGYKYVCQNSHHSPGNPMLPGVVAVRKCSPAFEFEDADLMTDRNNLNKLFDFLTESDPEHVRPRSAASPAYRGSRGRGGWRGGGNSSYSPRRASGSTARNYAGSRGGTLTHNDLRNVASYTTCRIDVDFLTPSDPDSDDEEFSDADPSRGLLVLIRWEERNGETIPPGEFRGFGFNFLERHTKFFSAKGGSSNTVARMQKEGSSHHRIVYYELCGIKFLVRFHGDACPFSLEEFGDWANNNEENTAGEADDSDDSPGGNGSSADQLAAELASLGVTKSTQKKNKGSIGVKLTPFNVFPESQLVSIKTRGMNNRLDLDATLKQTYFSQTPYLYVAYHNRGDFQPEDVEIHSTGELFPKWEEENKILIAKICIMLKKIKEAIAKASKERNGEQVGAALVFQLQKSWPPRRDNIFGSSSIFGKPARSLKLYEREEPLDMDVFQ